VREVGAALAAALVGLSIPAAAGGEVAPGHVDAARVRAADAEPGSWLVHGRTWAEQRFSPLDQIHRGNVAGLGLAWSHAMGTRRGLEASPIAVDGWLVVTGTWSVVVALDAATGAVRWRYDPEVPRAKGRHACCDVVNRGVAVWEGRVYVGTIDARLIALDLATGRELWSVQTADPEQPYTITGAPRVVDGRVVIGNGGAEYGVRGYFGAYDAESGALLWRFYTVPRAPEHEPEHPELVQAAATWSPDSLWASGLGGTVWDSFAYDPELGLLYVGVGNGSVYDREKRSPGGGDNLFLSSILAVRPDTGRLVWHYQTTPGDHWDYTATQHMILADLEWQGKPRKVLLQAPKNGFFYVLDRATGELLSAEKYANASWATHVDPATGRPVERPEARWSGGRAWVSPGPPGAHNWQPMAWSPRTRLVYIPTADTVYPYIADPDFRWRPGVFNTGEDLGAFAEEVEAMPGDLRFCSPSHLTAWDPVRERVAWRVAHDDPTPGGVLATAGDLVFQGHGGGVFAAYDARSGERLWSSPVGVGIMAPPVTYAIDGVQYVAVLAGIGGTHGGHLARMQVENDGHLLVYRLGGEAPLPEVRPRAAREVAVSPADLDTARVAAGRKLYGRLCMNCHGMAAVGSGLHPDLRYASRATHERWSDIVLGGIRQGRGMASFADVLDAEQARAIQHYVIARSLATADPGLLSRLVAWLGERGLCVPAAWMAD